jgi:hypothetical protein
MPKGEDMEFPLLSAVILSLLPAGFEAASRSALAEASKVTIARFFFLEALIYLINMDLMEQLFRTQKCQKCHRLLYLLDNCELHHAIRTSRLNIDCGAFIVIGSAVNLTKLLACTCSHL